MYLPSTLAYLHIVRLLQRAFYASPAHPLPGDARPSRARLCCHARAAATVETTYKTEERATRVIQPINP